ncbi:MAG: glutathione S-transferase family protein [Acidobacteriota bacterium]
MSDQVAVYGFETSNNFKVRVALGYKDIPYAFHTIDPGDRAELLRLSGQPLTPVIVHGDAVLFDSAAILRYLDANFLDTPRLFPADAAVLREVEAWESFARRELHEPIMIVVRQRLAGRTDAEEIERAGALFAEVTSRLEERLTDRDWLVSEQMTAADVTAAAVVFRAREAGAFPFPEGRPRMQAWMHRVMAYDRGSG